MFHIIWVKLYRLQGNYFVQKPLSPKIKKKTELQKTKCAMRLNAVVYSATRIQF